MSLKGKAIYGMVWTFCQQFSVQIISFCVSLVLARLLQPAEFGLVAMIALLVALGNVLIDSGLTSSLIRTEHIDESDLSTVFYVNVGASVLIYLFTFFCAPLVATFYKQPALTLIIRVYTLSFIINSFVSVQSTLLTKEMNFKKQMLIQVPIVIISGISGIVMAYNGFGVWSLVLMTLLQATLNVILHWVSSKWYPRLIFNKAKFKYHFKFGYKLMASGILDTLFENLIGVLIGKYYKASQLAFYNRSYALEMLPVQNISSALNKVTYPLFSHMQDDNEKLKKAYRILLVQVIFWTIPVMLYMQVFAQPIISFLLTDKWMGAVPFLQILCFHGVLYPLHVYNLNILLVKGRSDLFFRLEVIKKAIFVIGIFIFFPFGVYGLAWWLVISSIISFFINSMYSGKLIGYSVWEQIRDIFPSLLLGFSTWAVVKFFLFQLTAEQSNLIQIISGLVAFFLAYLSVAFVTKMNVIKDLKTLFKKAV